MHLSSEATNPQAVISCSSLFWGLLYAHLSDLSFRAVSTPWKGPSLWLFPTTYLEQTRGLCSKIERPKSPAVTAQLQFQTDWLKCCECMKANGNILFWKCDVWALSRGWTYFSKECLSQEKLSLLNLFQDWRKHISPDASYPSGRYSSLCPQAVWLLPSASGAILGSESVPAPWSAEVRGTARPQLLSQTPPQSYSLLRNQGTLPGTFRAVTRSNTKYFFRCPWNMPHGRATLHFQLLGMASAFLPRTKMSGSKSAD